MEIKFAIYKGTSDKIKSFTDVATATPKSTTTAEPGDLVHKATSIEGTTTIKLPNLEELLAIGGSSTYTIVLWINETGFAQNGDQGNSFAGGIFFTTENDSNMGITGVITA